MTELGADTHAAVGHGGGNGKSAKCLWPPSTAPTTSFGHPSPPQHHWYQLAPIPQRARMCQPHRHPALASPLQTGDTFTPSQTPCRAGGAGGKQSPAVFFLLLEQAPVFGQANCTINSPGSSCGVSRGQQCCLRPPWWPCPPVLALHPHTWDVSLEGMTLWGAQKPLDTHSLKASLPKPPPQSSPLVGAQ